MSISVSFLEIYNEKIQDLLNPSDKALNIRESPEAGIFVDGLCEVLVRDAADMMRLVCICLIIYIHMYMGI